MEAQGMKNEEDVIYRYMDDFAEKNAESFKDLFDTIRKKNGMSLEDYAERIHTDPRSLSRWIGQEDKKHITPDFLIMMMSIFKMPDWLTDLAFETAGISMNPRTNGRHRIFKHIIRSMWTDSVDDLNRYLKEKGQAPLQV